MFPVNIRARSVSPVVDRSGTGSPLSHVLGLPVRHLGMGLKVCDAYTAAAVRLPQKWLSMRMLSESLCCVEQTAHWQDGAAEAALKDARAGLQLQLPGVWLEEQGPCRQHAQASPCLRHAAEGVCCLLFRVHDTCKHPWRSLLASPR